MVKPVLVFVALALLGGCAYWPFARDTAPPDASPTKPIEAFEAVGDVHRPIEPPATQPESLSNDIQRLQDAKRAYQAAQDHHAAQTRLHQERCRKAGGEQVPIQEAGLQTDNYCQLQIDQKPVSSSLSDLE